MKTLNPSTRSKARKRFFGVLSVVFSSVITIALLEAVFAFLVNQRDKPAQADGFQGRPATIVDPDLGVVSPPDTTVTHIKKADGKVLFDVTYTYDSNGMRVTPFADSTAHSRYAQFYGCSFIFGWGLNDTETLPYYFSRDNPEYRSYNFAESGYGPQQMLALLEKGTPKKTVKEKDGFAIYTYLDDHVLRVADGTYSLKRLEGLTPYYELKGDKFIRKGFFADHYSLKNLVFRLMNKSYICRYFNIEYPFNYKPARKHYAYTAKMIKAAAEAYTRQFNNDNFYVLIYPIPNFYGPNDVFVEELKKLDLKVLDYSHLIDMKLDRYSITGDWHPRGLANETVEKKLSSDLAK